MWNTLKHIKKFTARAELEQPVAKPKLHIEDRLVYYHSISYALQGCCSGLFSLLG